MKNQLLFTLLFLLGAHVGLAQCNPKEYNRIFSEAVALQEKGEFIEAKNRYEAAKIYACGQKERDAADGKVDALFEQIERLRKAEQAARDSAEIEKAKAQKSALTIYANNLIFNSALALRQGDRATAFRLAEFVHRYVQPDSPTAAKALADALYIHRGNRAYIGKMLNLASLLSYNHVDVGNRARLTSFKYTEGVDRLLDVSPDHHFMAVAFYGSIKIIDSETGNIISTLQDSSQISSGCGDISADGRLLATTDSERHINIWDIEKSKKTMEISSSHNEYIADLAFSPDGRFLASASSRSVIIWDIKSGKQVITLKKRKMKYITRIVFSPDSKFLAIAAEKAYVFDIEKKVIIVLIKGDRFDSFNDVDFSSDNKKIIITNYTNVKVFDASTGSLLSRLYYDKGGSWISGTDKKKYIPDLKGASWSALTPDGNFLAIALSDEIIISNFTTGEVVSRINQTGQPFFSPTEKLIFSIRDDGTKDDGIKTYDWQVKDAPLIYDNLGNGSWTTDINFSPNGKYLVATTEAGSGRTSIFDVESHKTIRYITNFNSNACFSFDSKILATAKENEITLYSIDNYQETNSFKTNKSSINSINFSPDDKNIIATYGDSTIILWDIKANKIAKQIKSNTGSFNYAVYSPDGQKIAVTSNDNTAKILDAEKFKEISVLHGHNYSVTHLAFSPDGNYIATASEDKTVKIWNSKTARLIKTLEGFGNIVTSVAFSPDGKQIATSDYDAEAKVWEVSSGDLLFEFEGAITKVIFSPDGKQLLGAHFETSVWELTCDKLIQRWKETGSVNLTLPQMQLYNLRDLLDVRADNEQKLIASGETWQIAAFADLYAEQLKKNSQVYQKDYERASQLYQACLSQGVDNVYFQKKIDALNVIWKAKGEKSVPQSAPSPNIAPVIQPADLSTSTQSTVPKQLIQPLEKARKSKDLTLIEQSTRAALLDQPNRNWAIATLAHTLTAQGKYDDEAKPLYEKLLQRNKGYASSLLRDLEDFEREVVTHPDFKKAKAFIESKK